MCEHNNSQMTHSSQFSFAEDIINHCREYSINVHTNVPADFVFNSFSNHFATDSTEKIRKEISQSISGKIFQRCNQALAAQGKSLQF